MINRARNLLNRCFGRLLFILPALAALLAEA